MPTESACLDLPGAHPAAQNVVNLELPVPNAAKLATDLGTAQNKVKSENKGRGVM